MESTALCPAFLLLVALFHSFFYDSNPPFRFVESDIG